MTSKDYEIIAAAICNAKRKWVEQFGRDPVKDEGLVGMGFLAGSLIESLERDSPRFNRAMFLAACRGE